MNATVAAEAPPSFSMRLLERNLVPDWLIRRGIRQLLAQRLREEDMGNPEAQQKRLMDLIARLCDPVIVMAQGEVIAQGPMAEIRANPEIIEAYFGAPVEAA